jgi:CDP-diacylglycerol---glycerol-3-phosphate 3-phosphatidyltransferase
LSGTGATSSPVAPSLVNLPNSLTVLRLALVPVFVACLVTDTPGWRITAFLVFGVASATDLLDGELARRQGMITDFGKIADPIADKALTGSALITLSVLGELSWWITIVIGIREIGVTVLRFWVLRHGVLAASRGGKIKTVLQMAAIGLYILPIHDSLLRSVVMAAAVAVTLVTGADYVARAFRLRQAVSAPDGMRSDTVVLGRSSGARARVDASAGADAGAQSLAASARIDADGGAGSSLAASPHGEPGPGE